MNQASESYSFQNETVDEICHDFIEPGAMVNRLICDPKCNKEFVQKVRAAMKMAVDYVVTTPEEHESTDHEKILTPMVEQIRLLNAEICDYAAKRLSSLGVLMIKPETFDQYVTINPIESGLASFEFNGKLAQFMNLQMAMAGGKESYAEIHEQTLKALPPNFKHANEQTRFVVAMCGAAMQVYRDKVFNADRIAFSLNGFIESMINARDISNLVSVISAKPVEEIFIERAASLISEVMKDTNAVKVVKLAGEEAKDFIEAAEKASLDSNSSKFPENPTIH